MTTLLSTRKGVPHRLLAGGAAAAMFFIPADVVGALTRPEYNPVRHWISHLALGKHGWVGTAVLLVTAVLLLVHVAGILIVRMRAGGSTAYPVAVAVGAVGLLLAAVFPMEPSLGFPPGAERPGGITGVVHDVAGPLFLLGNAAAAILSRRHLASHAVSARSARWGAWIGTASAGSFVICSVLVGLDYSGVLPGAPSGLSERLAAYLGLGWAAVTAHTLRRALASGHRPDPVPLSTAPTNSKGPLR